MQLGPSVTSPSMAPNSNVPSYIVQVISYNQAQGSPSSIPMLSGYQLWNIPAGTGIKSFPKKSYQKLLVWDPL